MAIRTSAPTTKTLMLSLLILSGGISLWFLKPEFGLYAFTSIVVAYIVLLCGNLFKGV